MYILQTFIFYLFRVLFTLNYFLQITDVLSFYKSHNLVWINKIADCFALRLAMTGGEELDNKGMDCYDKTKNSEGTKTGCNKDSRVYGR